MLPTVEQKDKDEQGVVKPGLQADHSWFNSQFTQLIAPLFGIRYLFEAFEDINPKNWLRKDIPQADPLDKAWRTASKTHYVTSLNFVSHGVGAVFGLIMGSYSLRTLSDIKSVYSEAVGYELGKKPEDVTLGDVFLKSQNAAVGVTRHAYITRTLMRAATVATFFVPWHKFRSFQEVKPKYDANAKVGVGAIAAYIYGEGFIREPSFFDMEQKMVSAKVNHKDINPYIKINPEDVQGLMILQRKHMDSSYQRPAGASPDGIHDMELASSITELLNQTYQNIPNTEPAHFTIGKFNFLLGFGLLEKFPESMAFVELANKSTDMSEVKQAAGAIKAGQNPQAVFAQFGVDVNAVSTQKAIAAPQAEISEKKFVDTVQSTHEKSIAHKSHQDYAAHNAGAHLAV